MKLQLILQKYHLNLPLTEEEDDLLSKALDYEKPLYTPCHHTTLSAESTYLSELYL